MLAWVTTVGYSFDHNQSRTLEWFSEGVREDLVKRLLIGKDVLIRQYFGYFAAVVRKKIIYGNKNRNFI